MTSSGEENFFIPENDRSQKLEEISQIQNLIFSSTTENSSKADNTVHSGISKDSTNLRTSPKKLSEHANFVHNFKEYNLSSHDLVPLYLLRHHNTDEAGVSSSMIPVITNINVKDSDTIEITRAHLYKDYFNKTPYPTEKIIIKRNVQKDKKEVLLSYSEDRMKKEITSFFLDGTFTKVAKFKQFRNPNELLFMQNIYYYRCVLDTYFYYKSLKKLEDKAEFDVKEMTYHEFMKNLF